jgi:chitinase
VSVSTPTQRFRALLAASLVAWAVAIVVACADTSLAVIGPAPAGSPEGGPGVPGGAHLAVYWGQDLYGGANPDAGSSWEQPLTATCAADSPYDFVILAYVTNVASGAYGTPEFFAQNFANHCTMGSPLPGAPGLQECADIAAGIAACHQAGKKVLVSIGVGDPGLESDTDGGVGAQAAESMWDLYLGGNGQARPFPGQTLDGVDLGFVLTGQGPPSPGFTRFASRLRELMNASGGAYLLTATPQCGFPDPSLGPGMGTVLGDALGAFDAIFVEFYYDAACTFVPGDAGNFHSQFQSWATLMRNGRPKIFAGLSLVPTDIGYVDRASLPTLVNDVQNNPAFGGIVLRDESYDQNSADSTGMTYGGYAKSLLP